MRERIMRLARGIVDAETPKIFLNPVSVEETLGSDTVYKRELYLASENNLSIKGLAYSDNSRIKIIKNAFGGLRNHVVYEVDTSWCENGDQIKGSFTLVTNSGEFEIPFLFHIETIPSIRVLSTLKTVEDFVSLARKDMELALRLMEYKDFSEAPMFRDLRIRTIYEGLKGHGNRQNALEEFFLAAGVKEPISLTVSSEKKTYDRLTDVVDDKVILQKNTWGYLYIEVKADGDFIELPQKVITQADFKDDRMDLPFKIHSERMHKGKNLGAIHLITVHEDHTIPIEAYGASTERSRKDGQIERKALLRYLKLRESLESGKKERRQVLGKIRAELDAIRGASGSSLPLLLMQAEAFFESKKKEQARNCLNEVREHAAELKNFSLEFYGYYRYVDHLLEPENEKKEELLELLKRASEEKKQSFFFDFLALKAAPELLEEPGAVAEAMKNCYKNGCHSPFLYLQAVRLFEKNPDLLQNMDSFEIHALYYGVKNHLIEKELADRICLLASSTRVFHRLHYRVLAGLFEKYPTKEMLTAVCCILIKGNIRETDSFSWYEAGIKQEISLTRIYEYFLYSIPDSYEQMMPRRLLLYFSYESGHLDKKSRAALYANVVTYVPQEDPLYKKYEREMESFAMDQLFAGRIDRRLALIYRHIIYKDMIDRQVAKILPEILKTNRIQVKDPGMKYVIVSNEILTGEDAYPLNDGVAYVPLYFDESLIMFQDTFGNRYLDVEYEKEAVMEEADLEERCFEIYPDHPMLKMKACLKVMEKQDFDQADVKELESALDELPLKPAYQQKLMTRIIAYYRSTLSGEEDPMDAEGGTYLLKLDKKELSRSERVDVCETLIVSKYLAAAYEMVTEFGEEGIRPRRLALLASGLILERMFAEEERLLAMAYRAFAEGQADSVIVDYLCEHYNGGEDAMYRILVHAVKTHVETYDLEERLLAQCLFSGTERHMDTVFDLYASRKQTGDMIVKAYFTVRCTEFFLRDKVPGDRFFTYLESLLKGMEIRKVPEIYLLAWAKYDSMQVSLSEEQRELLNRIMDVLSGRGMVFAWYRQLAKHVDMPGDVMDKEIIEYHTRPDARPVLKVRILPDEEKFHDEEMKMVYKGIFVHRKLLFDGEIMEYEIWEQEGDESVKKAQGEITCTETKTGDKGNRFAALNTMNLYLGMKDDRKLEESMTEYVTDGKIAENLFCLA